MKEITLPLSAQIIENLQAGDQVLLTGKIYTARDAAHKRMYEEIQKGNQLPINVKGQVIYYVGPTPTKPGHIIGSAGPTTSGRMDKYTPKLLELGLKGMIGKGYRNNDVKNAIIKHKAIYFAAIGGTAALLSKSIKSVQTIAYDDLGTEAIRLLEVIKFPVIVINDIHGGDFYQDERDKYRQKR